MSRSFENFVGQIVEQRGLFLLDEDKIKTFTVQINRGYRSVERASLAEVVIELQDRYDDIRAAKFPAIAPEIVEALGVVFGCVDFQISQISTNDRLVMLLYKCMTKSLRLLPEIREELRVGYKKALASQLQEASKEEEQKRIGWLLEHL